MLNVNVYEWKDMREKKVVVNENGDTEYLSKLTKSNKIINKQIALINIFNLYGLSNVEIGSYADNKVKFDYDTTGKYGSFLKIYLQSLVVQATTSSYEGKFYWKPVGGATGSDVQQWNIGGSSIYVSINTNGVTLNCGHVVEAMDKLNTYLYQNSGTYSVFEEARSLIITNEPVKNSSTQVVFEGENHALTTLTQIGKYGIQGNHFQLATHRELEEWSDSGYVYNDSQDYGFISGSKIKKWASAETPKNQVVFETFTTNSKHDFTINKSDFDLVVEYNGVSRTYFLAEGAKVKLYSREVATPTITFPTEGFPNRIPFGDSSGTYPSVVCRAGWAVVTDFQLYLTPPNNQQYDGLIPYLDYTCNVNCNNIKVGLLDNDEYVISTNKLPGLSWSDVDSDLVLTTEGSYSLGSLMKEATPLPIQPDDYYGETPAGAWISPKAEYATNPYVSVQASSTVTFANYVFWNAIGEQLIQPRIRGLLNISNYQTLKFIQQDTSKLKPVAIGGFEFNPSYILNPISGIDRLLYLTVIRKYQLLPGIADLPGWNMLTDDKDCFNSARMSSNVYENIKYHASKTTSGGLQGWVANNYASIGFEHDGTSNRCAYALTIEYNGNEWENSSDIWDIKYDSTSTNDAIGDSTQSESNNNSGTKPIPGGGSGVDPIRPELKE